MKDGFVKFAACSPLLRVADCDLNMEQIALEMEKAAKDGAQVCVFPELALSGATCGDLFFQTTLLEGCEKALADLMEKTAPLDVMACVGLPVQKGGQLYNCAAVFSKGVLLGVVPKCFVRSDSEINECRHFAGGAQIKDSIFFAGQQTPFGADLLFEMQEVIGCRMAVEIGSDLWAPRSAAAEMALGGAVVILNPAAYSEGVGREEFVTGMVQSQSARLMCGYVCARAGEGESTTDMVFSGTQLIAENGTILSQSRPFETGMTSSELDISYLLQERRKTNVFKMQETSLRCIPFSLSKKEISLSRTYDRFPFFPKNEKDPQGRCELILDMQARGLARRMEHAHAKTVVIGISGGLDSCLALLVARRTMDILKRPASDIIAVTMPCFGTTNRTKSNAQLLSEQLGTTFLCIPITKTVLSHFEEIGHDPENHNVVFENAQARARTYVLMDLANARGGLVVGTGDLSELALGWATYNGDHMSMYGVNADVPKTLVRRLVAHCAQKAEADLARTLEDILDTPVSPELLPSKEGVMTQVTEDIVGPYELHDFILYYAVGKGFSPAKVYRLMVSAFVPEYREETLKKWLMNFYHRFFIQQFKRSCLPDGVKVGSISFSPRGGWQMPSDAVSKMWKKEIENL